MALVKALVEPVGGTYIGQADPDHALTIWSIPQFEQFQTFFSHGLSQLQEHLNRLSAGDASPDGSALLMSSLVSVTKAMTTFLRRRYDMMQRLHGLGRVVDTESSRTWYAQPENLWLRRAVADLKAKCDAFTWVGGQICQASEATRHLPSVLHPSARVTAHRQSKPILRSYNSFSSLGSELPRLQGKKNDCRHDDSDLSSPKTNPFSDASSVYSPKLFSTGPSSLSPSSPVEGLHAVGEGPSSEGTGQDRSHDHSNGVRSAEHMFSAALRDLLALNLR